MIKRIIFIALAVTLLSCVIVLGFNASRDSRYVIWFGLAAAILAPLALMVFGQALKSNDRALLAQLTKVPQVRELMEKAKSEEERIREYSNRSVRSLTIQLDSRRVDRLS